MPTHPSQPVMGLDLIGRPGKHFTTCNGKMSLVVDGNDAALSGTQQLRLVPFHRSFSAILRSIGKFCDIDVIYVGKETAIENNIQYGSYCYLKLHSAEATDRGKDNCVLLMRVRIDLRVEEGTVVLSDYIIKNRFSRNAVVQLTSYDSLAEGKIAGKINVTCDINPNIHGKHDNISHYTNLFKQYMYKYEKEIRILGSRTCQLMLTDKDRNILVYSITVADAETSETFYTFDKKNTKMEITCNFHPIKDNVQTGEDKMDQFSRDLVHNICSLRTVVEDILKYVRVHSNNLIHSHKSLLPRSVILCGKHGSGRSIVCRKLAIELKGIYPEEAIFYASVRGDGAQASMKGKVEESLKDVYNKIKELDDPYVLILDDVHSLIRDGGANQGKNKNERTLLLKIIDHTVQANVQSFVVCVADSTFPICKKMTKPDRIGRIFEIKTLSSKDRFNALQMFTTQYEDHISAENCTQDVVQTVSGEDTEGFLLQHLHTLVKSSCFKSLSLRKTAKSLKPFIHHETANILVPSVNFNDIGGYDNVKKRLLQLNGGNSNENTSAVLKAKRVTGILLHGPSGCGKTKMVEAFACETNSYLILLRASALLSPYLGESERILRETFKNASISSKSILFIDEIDAIIPARNFDKSAGATPIGIGERLLSTLLNCMDGLVDNPNVLVVAATTRLDTVDPALRRPGRLGKFLPSLISSLPLYTVVGTNNPFYCFSGTSIEIPLPTKSDVLQIFRLYARKYGLNLFLDGSNNKQNFPDSDKLTALGPAIDTMLTKYYATRKKLVKGALGLSMNIENEKLTGATIESICRGEAMGILRHRIRLRMKEERA